MTLGEAFVKYVYMERKETKTLKTKLHRINKPRVIKAS
jgi:hypothetical protein